MSELWAQRKVVVCVGTGGVGKTTVSAAIGVAAAAAGRKTLVMTIDPARRLANALGLSDFGNVELRVDSELLERHGVTLKAPLWAMMPDVKRTFDELIERTAPSAEARNRILQNRIYKQFSTVLAGSLDYAAVEKLYEVYTSERYDLIVLDTPPAQNALDFLDAPGRILDFLDQESLQWLSKPSVLAGKFSLRFLDLSSSFVLRTLGKMAGGEVLQELADFILRFRGMYDGFRQRARNVSQLLESDELAFLLVTAPTFTQVPAMLSFRDALAAEGLSARGLIINRVRRPFLDEAAEATLDSRLAELFSDTPEASPAVAKAIDEEHRLALLHQEVLEHLSGRLGNLPRIALPELRLDAHDLESLSILARALA